MSTYYVDQTLGNDGNDGLSEANAWKTINKVQTVLTGSQPDTVVKGKCGEVWREQYTPAGYGTSGHQFVHSYYGTGDKPKILGSTQVTGWDQTDIPGGTGDLSDESFEGAGYEESWAETVGSGSVVDEDNADVARPTGGGDQLLKIQKVSPNYNAFTERDLGSEKPITYTRFYVRYAAHGLGDGNNMRIANALDGSWSTAWRVSLQRTGANIYFKWDWYNNGGYDGAVDSTVLSVDTWYRIDVKHDATNHILQFRINESVARTETLTGTHRGGIRLLGLGNASDSYTLTAYYDLVGISSTAYISDAIALPAGTWKATHPSVPIVVWFVETDEAVTWGKKETVMANVNAEYDWYFHANGYLIVYAATDPDSRYAFVEASTRNNGIVNDDGKDYITVQGFEIAYVAQHGIAAFAGCDGWLIDGHTIHHIGAKEADDAQGIIIRGSNVTTQNNTISECGTHGIYVNAISGSTAINVIVQNNTVFNIYHSAIDCHNLGGIVNGVIFRYNHIYWDSDYPATNNSIGMYFEGQDTANKVLNMSCYYNIIHDVPSYGIMTDNWVNINFYNNIVFRELSGNTTVGGTVGIWIGGSTSSIINLKNNIGSDFDIVFYVPTDMDQVGDCDNNCWYHSAGGTKVYASVEGTSYHYDDFAAYKAATGFDTNGKWEDPLFVDKANNNFHLRYDSPCLDVGIDVGLSEDFEGNPVPYNVTPDIGAYEYQGPVALVVSESNHAHGIDGINLTQLHNLTVGEALHIQGAESPVLTQLHNLIVSECLHAQGVESPILTQLHNLIVAESLHNQVAEEPILTQVHNILISESTHPHDVESPTLTQVHNLVILESLHSQLADSPTLIQDYVLAMAEALHLHTADNIDLSGTILLIIADALHEHNADSPILIQLHNLTIPDSAHAQSVDSPLLTQLHNLIIASIAHAHTADSPVLSQAHILAISEALHALASDPISLTQLHNLIVSECLHNQTVDPIILNQAHLLAVSDGGHNHLTDGIMLSQIHHLLVDASLHGQTVDPIILAQAHVLAMADGGHALTSDNLLLVQNILLIVAEALHAFTADSPVLATTHILAINDALHLLTSDSIAIVQLWEYAPPEKHRKYSCKGTGLKRDVHFIRRK